MDATDRQDTDDTLGRRSGLLGQAAFELGRHQRLDENGNVVEVLEEITLDDDLSSSVDQNDAGMGDTQCGLVVDVSPAIGRQDSVVCRDCRQTIVAGEPRYAWGEGWVCFACGEARRGPAAGYVGQGFATPISVKPLPAPVRRRQWRWVAVVSAAVLLIPTIAGVIVYFSAVDSATIARAQAAAESESAHRSFDHLIAIASTQGASKNYDYAIARLREAEALLATHTDWQPNVTAEQLAEMERGFQRQINELARLQTEAARIAAIPTEPKPVESPEASLAPVPSSSSTPQPAAASAQAPPAPTPSTTPPPADPSAALASAAPLPTKKSDVQPDPAPQAAAPTPEAEWLKSLRQPDAPTPPPAPPAKPEPPADPVTADDFVDVGSKALIAGDLKTAQLNYVRAQKLQPGNERAAVGQSLIMYLRGSTTDAINALEILNINHTTRLSAQNLAAMYQYHNMLRSARLMYDYLRKADRLDPEAFDYYVLGMWNAQWGRIKTGFYWKMSEFYDVYEQQLRLARNGGNGGPEERRWGKTWISPEESRAKIDQLNESRAQLQLTNDLLANRKRAEKTIGTGGNPPASLKMDDEVANARYKVYEAFRGVQAAAPPMPTDIPFMVP